jgi:LysR family hydrogen peroxide-inducible transcriptional activator
MNKPQLEYALALQKHGNYSKAAKHLGITQPALSLQIKKLESSLGIYLFDRSKKPLSVTFEGVKFLTKAQAVVNQFTQLESFAQSLKEDFAGEIVVGIIPTLSPYLVPLFIGSLNEKYPLLKVTIKEAITEQIIEGVTNGEIQLGIVATPIITSRKFDIQPLFYESFQLFISDDHPLSSQKTIDLDNITPDDIWLLKEGNCFRDQVNNICGFSKKNSSNQKFTYESNSIEALCRIVEYQGGITFLPELSTIHLSEEREDMLKDISGHKRVREISMLSIPNETRIRFIEKIKESIQSNIPSSMLSDQNREVIDTGVVI